MLTLPVRSQFQRGDDTTLSSGEFGSIDPGSATTPYLNFRMNHSQIFIHARLLQRLEAFGVAHRDYAIALTVNREKNIAKLEVELVGRDFRLRSQSGRQWSEIVARVYEFAIGENAPVNWRRFKLKGTGCYVLLE